MANAMLKTRPDSRLLLGLAVLLAGCSQSNSISGIVTYDGQPIKEGVISFAPLDGAGTLAGSEIDDGKYSIAEITPGKKRVVVTALDTEADVPERGRRLPNGMYEDVIIPELVPAEAKGNFAEHEIASGDQTLNLDLMPPGA